MDLVCISDLEDKTSLHGVILQRLKKHGVCIKSCKEKKIPTKKHGIKAVFGVPLVNLPVNALQDNTYVPTILVDLISCIRLSLTTEGIFRKAGSVNRQKEIKSILQKGGEFNSEWTVVDIACVLKQWLRDLPEPLICPWLHDHFTTVSAMSDAQTKVDLILALCFCLPTENLYTLRYLMLFFNEVASHSEMNKMDSSNLAVIVTPNLMMTLGDKLENFGTKQLQQETQVVFALIENADRIAMVDHDLMERTNMWGNLEEITDQFNLGASTITKTVKKTRRSGSINGVFNGLKRMVQPLSSKAAVLTNSKLDISHVSKKGEVKTFTGAQVLSPESSLLAFQNKYDSPDVCFGLPGDKGFVKSEFGSGDWSAEDTVDCSFDMASLAASQFKAKGDSSRDDQSSFDGQRSFKIPALDVPTSISKPTNKFFTQVKLGRRNSISKPKLKEGSVRESKLLPSKMSFPSKKFDFFTPDNAVSRRGSDMKKLSHTEVRVASTRRPSICHRSTDVLKKSPYLANDALVKRSSESTVVVHKSPTTAVTPVTKSLHKRNSGSSSHLDKRRTSSARSHTSEGLSKTTTSIGSGKKGHTPNEIIVFVDEDRTKLTPAIAAVEKLQISQGGTDSERSGGTPSHKLISKLLKTDNIVKIRSSSVSERIHKSSLKRGQPNSVKTGLQNFHTVVLHSRGLSDPGPFIVSPLKPEEESFLADSDVFLEERKAKNYIDQLVLLPPNIYEEDFDHFQVGSEFPCFDFAPGFSTQVSVDSGIVPGFEEGASAGPRRKSVSMTKIHEGMPTKQTVDPKMSVKRTKSEFIFKKNVTGLRTSSVIDIDSSNEYNRRPSIVELEGKGRVQARVQRFNAMLNTIPSPEQKLRSQRPKKEMSPLIIDVENEHVKRVKLKSLDTFTGFSPLRSSNIVNIEMNTPRKTVGRSVSDRTICSAKNLGPVTRFRSERTSTPRSVGKRLRSMADVKSLDLNQKKRRELNCL